MAHIQAASERKQSTPSAGNACLLAAGCPMDADAHRSGVVMPDDELSLPLNKRAVAQYAVSDGTRPSTKSR